MGKRAPIFDTYCFVDWSASSKPSPIKPSADAIWVGVQSGRSPATTHYFRTRLEAFGFLHDAFSHFIQSGRRVLAGFDFPLGYSHPILREPGVPFWESIWKALYSQITDDASNANNRFQFASAINMQLGLDSPGPFWGCPAGRETVHLRRTSPSFPIMQGKDTIPRLRFAERALPGTQEAWKLLGVGSAGSQALLGIPYLQKLRMEFKNQMHVWPMETGFASNPCKDTAIVITEAWPGIIREKVAQQLQANPEQIRDQVQVLQLCAWAKTQDLAGKLSDFFEKPGSLNKTEVERCLKLEGWILGAK
jgi:hypothetical protein